jgi:acetate kinase
MRILVVNAGSASVKLRVLEGDDQLVATSDLGPPDVRLGEQLAAFLDDAPPVDVVGHRVVHGGPVFSAPT